MKKKILNLADVKVNDILKLVGKNEDVYYCIVKSCEPNVEPPFFLSEKQKNQIADIESYDLRLVEFNLKSPGWGMTFPSTTEDMFVSLIDKDHEYTLFDSSLEEVEIYLKLRELQEIETIFEKAAVEVKSVKSTYKNIVQKSLKKLVPKTLEEV